MKITLTLESVKYSDYMGFWSKLRKIGYKPYKLYYLDTKNKTVFAFIKNSSIVKFIIRKHKVKLQFYTNNTLKAEHIRCSFSLLEDPFKKYFGLEKPLCLNTLERAIAKRLQPKKRKRRKKPNKKPKRKK